jgi:hypothetical protein
MKSFGHRKQELAIPKGREQKFNCEPKDNSRVIEKKFPDTYV